MSGRLAQSPLPGMRDRFHLAGLDQSDDRGPVGENELHLPRHDIGDGKTAAAIRDVIDLDAGGALEQFEQQMLQRAVAGRRHVDAVRRCLGIGNHIGHRRHRNRRRADQNVRHRPDQENRIEILAVIERQVGIERAVHRERRGIVQNRVAVGIGLGDHGLADGAAGAAAIFDGEWLAKIFAELGVDDARRGVGAAGRRIRHHDPHRPVRPSGLRARIADKRCRRHCSQHRAACESSSRHGALRRFRRHSSTGSSPRKAATTRSRPCRFPCRSRRVGRISGW